MLRKLVGDPSTILPLEGVDVEKNLTYEEVPVENLERQVKSLYKKDIALIKVLWRNQNVDSATWEVE